MLQEATISALMLTVDSERLFKILQVNKIESMLCLNADSTEVTFIKLVAMKVARVIRLSDYNVAKITLECKSSEREVISRQ